MIPSWAHDVKPEDITNATMLDLAELLGLNRKGADDHVGTDL